MTSEYDAELTQRVTNARHEVYEVVLQAASNERGAHLETALTALGYLAGTAILTNTGIDLSPYNSGTPILVEKVNDVGPEVVGNLLDLVAVARPPVPPISRLRRPHRSRLVTNHSSHTRT